MPIDTKKIRTDKISEPIVSVNMLARRFLYNAVSLTASIFSLMSMVVPTAAAAAADMSKKDIVFVTGNVKKLEEVVLLFKKMYKGSLPFNVSTDDGRRYRPGRGGRAETRPRNRGRSDSDSATRPVLYSGFPPLGATAPERAF